MTGLALIGPACGARRSFRHEHARGDAGVGFVHHDRVDVTA